MLAGAASTAEEVEEAEETDEFTDDEDVLELVVEVLLPALLALLLVDEVVAELAGLDGVLPLTDPPPPQPLRQTETRLTRKTAWKALIILSGLHSILLVIRLLVTDCMLNVIGYL